MSLVSVALAGSAARRELSGPFGRVLRVLRKASPRPALAVSLTASFVLLAGAVLLGSDVDRVDTLVLRWSASSPWPWLQGVASAWVLLGQRAVCLAIAAAWFTVRAVRRREIRPLVTLGVVTLLFNLSVGFVKMAVGRLGPYQLGASAVDAGASHIFTDGTVFPSGHTANAVVTWGLMAYLAHRHRRVGALAAALLALTVGLTTVYLGSHWVSDVLAGWIAGGLVLLAVPALTPLIDRLERFPAWLLSRRRSVSAPAEPLSLPLSRGVAEPVSSSR